MSCLLIIANLAGALSAPLSLSALLAHMNPPRKLGDHTYLSWNNAPAPPKQQHAGNPNTAAMASGRDIGA